MNAVHCIARLIEHIERFRIEFLNGRIECGFVTVNKRSKIDQYEFQHSKQHILLRSHVSFFLDVIYHLRNITLEKIMKILKLYL